MGEVEGVWNLLENHKLLFVTLIILIWTPIEKQLNPSVQLIIEGSPHGPM